MQTNRDREKLWDNQRDWWDRFSKRYRIQFHLVCHWHYIVRKRMGHRLQQIILFQTYLYLIHFHGRWRSNKERVGWINDSILDSQETTKNLELQICIIKKLIFFLLVRTLFWKFLFRTPASVNYKKNQNCAVSLSLNDQKSRKVKIVTKLNTY